MDDHLRSRLTHGLGDLIGIERVRHNRYSAHLFEHRPLRLVACHAMDLMPRLNQTRHQLLSNRSRRSRNKDSHRGLLYRGCLYLYKTRWQPDL